MHGLGGLLHTLLGKLTEMTSLQVILVLSKTDDIPTFITHVIPVEDRHCGPKITLQEYLAHREPDPAHVLSEEKRQRILDLPYADNLFHTEHIVDLNKVSNQLRRTGDSERARLDGEMR
mgnify:CR=1 FL=1